MACGYCPTCASKKGCTLKAIVHKESTACGYYMNEKEGMKRKNEAVKG